MRRIVEFIKTTLVGGVLIVLPVWVATLLLIKALGQLGGVVAPVSEHLPKEVNHPKIMAVVLLVLVCFLIGLLVRTVIGRRVARRVEENVFRKIPGYSTISGVMKQMGETHENRGFKPALVEMEGGLAPCFIVEECAEGQVTVFIPSAPTPAAGSIFIMPAGLVHPVDVSVTTMFKCVTKWGAGSGELLAGLQRRNEVEE